jgi:2-methylcitrate dehydratase PrpD
MSTVVKPAAFRQQGAASDTSTVSEKLADFAARFDLDQAPAKVVEVAKLHILDCFGIGLASTTMEYGQRAVTAARELGGEGPSPVIGMPVRLPLRDAAMVNGTLIHGLDFDDTHPSGLMHCSASAVPTMLAMATSRGRSGRDALAAYLMGIEAGTRIAKTAHGGVHLTGFHTTPIMGTFGCALIAGRLADLSTEQLVEAQGLALSMTSGTREYHSNGAWVKRMHPGIAAASAITAAGWAKHGFTGSRTPYEGPYGLYNAFGNKLEVDLATCTAGLGEQWEMLDVAYKPYPACHFNHAFIDAAIKLHKDHGLKPEEIDSVIALIHKEEVTAVCTPEARKRRPHSAYAAQFSVHYVISAALTRGRFTLDELDAESYTDPGILSLCDKVRYEETSETLFPRYFSGTVVVRTKDGRELKHYQKYNLGSDGNPITAENVIEKFWSNATRAVSRQRAQRVLDAIMGLDRAPDMRELEAAVCMGPK